MQKIRAKIITALLLSALALTLVPLAFASSGNILINDTTQPQDLPITSVPAGGNVSLYFGDISFSGSQFYLLLSQNGLSEVSSGDIRYTPLFNVAQVTASATITQVTGDTTYPGAWTIGQSWINGSTPLNVAGGTFYIKAFDGAVAALAVTQGFPVSASLRIIPDAGSAGTSIIISGNAFPANSLVNLTYLNPITGPPFITINNLTQTNALGQFNYTMNAPDLKTAPSAGDTGLPVPTNVIAFQATLNASTPVVYNATYTETQRGLLQFGRPRVSSTVPGSLQNATGVYGNLTSFVSTVSVGVGDTLRIVGNSFYPGTAAIRWDNSIDLSPATANQTGFFNTTVVVPGTGLGVHNVTLIDNGLQVFVVFVNVVQSITISPTSGPISTTVTVSGFGFPAQGSPSGTVYNATVTFGTSSTVRAWSLTDANGQFTTTFNVPTSAGGTNTVTATANDSALTAASKTFTVTSSFIVSPAEFYSNSSSGVTATGTGFDPAYRYFVAIDNQFSPFSNTTDGIAPSSSGGISFTFIQAGFQPGLHVVALYQVGLGTSAGGFNVPAANATFTVLTDVSSGNNTDLLTAINNTVTTINTNLGLVNATIVSINGTLATVQTDTGTILTTVNSINATVVSISGNVATVQTSIGTLQTSVDAINATVVTIWENVATVQTSIGTLQTSVNAINATVVSISGNIATIATSIGTLQTSVNAINATVNTINGNVATISTSVGILRTNVTSIMATLTAINNGFATVQTSVGTLTTSVNSISSTLSGVSGTVGTISSSVGSLSTDLSAINTKVTSIQNGIATIQTDLGTLQGTVTGTDGKVATIQTDIGELKADVSTLQTSVNDVPGQVNIPIWIAVVLALIAALAAIASLLLVRRKIAG